MLRWSSPMLTKPSSKIRLDTPPLIWNWLGFVVGPMIWIGLSAALLISGSGPRDASRVRVVPVRDGSMLMTSTIPPPRPGVQSGSMLAFVFWRDDRIPARRLHLL